MIPVMIHTRRWERIGAKAIRNEKNERERGNHGGESCKKAHKLDVK